MPTVLFLDDDYHIRALYDEELSEEGYDVITHGETTGLMDLIYRTKPDVLVMEIHLGKEDRWDLLQAIRERYPALPVILNTASLDLILEEEEMPAVAHVIKSVDMSELKMKIEAFLEGLPSYQWEITESLMPPASQQGEVAKPPLLLPYYSGPE